VREEEPISVECDFGVVYSLYLRPPQRGSKTRRLIVKVTWEEKDPLPDAELRSCTFELDLERELLTPLGRKGNSLPAQQFDAKWFCQWARRALREMQ
jgi:hypothetical protein